MAIKAIVRRVGVVALLVLATMLGSATPASCQMVLDLEQWTAKIHAGWAGKVAAGSGALPTEMWPKDRIQEKFGVLTSPPQKPTSRGPLDDTTLALLGRHAAREYGPDFSTAQIATEWVDQVLADYQGRKSVLGSHSFSKDEPARLTVALPITFIPCLAIRAAAFTSDDRPTEHRGIYEIRMTAGELAANPFFEDRATVTFTRPDGSEVVVDTFHDGQGQWKARAYCDQIGVWKWRSTSRTPRLDDARGQFEVVASKLPGKLRKHPDDPFQFVRDDGSWFLHIGDTGYRFVVATEPKWQSYIDQAAEAGFTKIRTWFAQSRNTVEALYTEDRSRLALDYWQEIDRRLLYSLEHHPQVVFQLIPYAEDTQEIRRYAKGDSMALLIGRAAQARWSAFPNVTWAISNDREVVDKGPLSGRRVLRSTIDRMGKDFAEREPWGTLMTNHQSRFSGYSFVDAPWSDIITLEDLDQVHGRIIAQYRKAGSDPIINDEDRYELYRNAGNRRYFFRRLMWGSILSGGHATYGGLKTYEAYDGGPTRGVQGYFDANRDGSLFQGAHDFRHIHRFFDTAELTMVGLQPDDALVGGDPLRWKCARNQESILVYLANPTGEDPETDNPAVKKPSVSIDLPGGHWNVRWFNPRTGEWFSGKPLDGSASRTLTAPHDDRSMAADYVLLLTQESP